MARQSKSDIQKKWEERIERGKCFKDEDFTKPFKVELGRDYFEGKQNPGWPENEWLTINKIYSHIKAQLPVLYAIDPYFYVKLKKSYKPDPMSVVTMEQKGKMRQAYLNYLKGETELKTKARMSIQDAFFAYGVIKTHFTAEEIENPDAGQPMLDDDEIEMIDPETGQLILEPDTIPINERYKVTRIHPDNLIFPEHSGPLDDEWPWIAERFVISKAQAKKNKWISKTALDDAPTKTKAEAEKDKKKGFFSVFSTKTDSDKKTSDQEYYVGYEIYDLENSEWLIIIEDAKSPAKDPGPLPKGTEDHPYSILRFTLRDKSPYPIPPVSQALDPQKELNMARSRIMTHRKRFNRKYVLSRQFFSDPDDAASKLTYGEDGTVLTTDAGDARMAVSAIQDAQLDQQTYLEISALNGDLVETLSTSGEARGLPQADSATQAALIDKRLEVREGDMLSQVVDWVTDIARKLDQLVQAHITEDEAVKIYGPQGEFWEMVKSTDYQAIDGEFEYSVNVGAMLPRLPQTERAQWMAFLQVLMGFPHLMTSKHFMTQMAELHHIEDENMVEELRQIGLQIMQGSMPMPGGGGGSQAGVPEDNAITKVLGAALGDQGGNANGGGAESLQQA